MKYPTIIKAPYCLNHENMYFSDITANPYAPDFTVNLLSCVLNSQYFAMSLMFLYQFSCSHNTLSVSHSKLRDANHVENMSWMVFRNKPVGGQN